MLTKTRMMSDDVRASAKSLARISIRNPKGDSSTPEYIACFFVSLNSPFMVGCSVATSVAPVILLGWYANSVQPTTILISIFWWCNNHNQKALIMTNLIDIDLSALSVQKNQVTTTSHQIAEYFGKEHKNVIRKIESLECSPDFTLAHFWAHVENIEAGAVYRDSKSYVITKNGFMFLVMGFTGKKAAKIKEAYINAFDHMAEKLTAPAPAPKTNNCICALANNEQAKTEPFNKNNLNVAMFTILNMVSQIDETYDLGLFKMSSFKLDFQNKVRQIKN